MKTQFFLYATLLGLIVTPCQPGEATRLALVIGNAAYERSPLDNPVYDAQDMAGMLHTFGFDVQLYTDIDRQTMVRAIQRFGEHLQAGGVGLFYYSGHGIQSKSVNYLLPLDADITSEADIEFEGVNANRVLGHMEQSNEEGVNILILDACRDTPYKSYLKGPGSGLAEMKGAPGTLIAYATAPGTVAYGEGGARNSLFTKHLIQLLKDAAGQSVTDMLIQVTDRVVQESERRQVPWLSASLTRRFCFAPCGQPAGSPPVQATQAPPAPTATPMMIPENADFGLIRIRVKDATGRELAPVKGIYTLKQGSRISILAEMLKPFGHALGFAWTSGFGRLEVSDKNNTHYRATERGPDYIVIDILNKSTGEQIQHTINIHVQ